MPDMQDLADSMLAAAATVLGRLVEQPAAATAATRNDHEGSIRTDGAELVAVAEIPALSAQVVVRFANRDMQQIVGLMLGGTDDGSEMGAMQLSIASETASQIAAAMCERLATEVGASSEGIVAELKSDATALPPPPFESYEGTIQLGPDLTPTLCVDFAAITLSRLGLAVPEAAPAPASASAAAPAAKAPKSTADEAVTPSVAPEARSRGTEPVSASAQSVAFSQLAPTPVRTAEPGQANLDLVHDVPLLISAVLGRTAMPLREVVSLQAGSVFELDKAAAEPIDLFVNNILIARGEVVVVDDKYAVKISELNPPVG
ncbi:MAG TPA: flagellar motor switch protein FliN [Candidatus Baltobacteraceae bacterium]|jgi:flagellar motor switch protein FliN/FliY